MKKYLMIMLLAIVTIGLSSCEEEKDELGLVIETNTNPEYLDAGYYSPDPGCGVPKQLVIHATHKGADLIVKSTKYDDINFMPTTDGETYVNEDASFSVTKIDNQTLKFHFEEVQSSEKEMVGADLTIYAQKKGERVTAGCFIDRYFGAIK